MLNSMRVPPVLSVTRGSLERLQPRIRDAKEELRQEPGVETAGPLLTGLLS